MCTYTPSKEVAILSARCTTTEQRITDQTSDELPIRNLGCNRSNLPRAVGHPEDLDLSATDRGIDINKIRPYAGASKGDGVISWAGFG